MANAQKWTVEELPNKQGQRFAVKLDGEIVTRFEDHDAAEAYIARVKDEQDG